MRKTQIIEDECRRIREVESRLYEGIRNRQSQLSKQIEEQKRLAACQEQRMKSIKSRNMEEQVKHPYNDRGGMWVYLANCIHEQDQQDLEGVRERQEQRRKFREQLQEQKQLQRMRKQYIVDDGVEVEEPQDRKKKAQVPWKLMRELREHDVRENKRRMENIREHQLRQVRSYHS